MKLLEMKIEMKLFFSSNLKFSSSDQYLENMNFFLKIYFRGIGRGLPWLEYVIGCNDVFFDEKRHQIIIKFFKSWRFSKYVFNYNVVKIASYFIK